MGGKTDYGEILREVVERVEGLIKAEQRYDRMA